REGAGIRAPCRRLEPGHVAPFLVRRDKDVLAFGPERGRQRRHLLAVAHVAREQHDAAEPRRDLAPHPLGRREPLEAGEQAAPGERGEAHPLTAPAVRLNAIFRCRSRKKTTTGTAVRVEAAMSAPQSVWRAVPEKYESQTVSVCFDWSWSRTLAKMYSFQLVMKAKTEVATSPGATRGSRIRTNAPRRLEPSTIAASSSSFGIPSRNPRSVQTENGSTKVMYVTITPKKTYWSCVRWYRLSTTYSGMINPAWGSIWIPIIR